MLQEAFHLRWVLALRIVLQHVRAEMDVTTENLVGTFAGIDYLVTGIAHRAAKQELRHAVTVTKDGFGVPDGFGEILRYIGLLNGNWAKICSRTSRHFARDLTFVVGRLVESERESLNWRIRMLSGEAAGLFPEPAL